MSFSVTIERLKRIFRQSEVKDKITPTENVASLTKIKFYSTF